MSALSNSRVILSDTAWTMATVTNFSITSIHESRQVDWATPVAGLGSNLLKWRFLDIVYAFCRVCGSNYGQLLDSWDQLSLISLLLTNFTDKRSKDIEVVPLNLESPSRTKAKRHISGASPLRPTRILEKECIWRTSCKEVGEMSKLGLGAALHINC